MFYQCLSWFCCMSMAGGIFGSATESHVVSFLDGNSLSWFPFATGKRKINCESIA